MGWFSDGDVVKYDGGFDDACAVLLKCHDKYCTALKLIDRVPDENVIEVIGKQKCWADAGKTIWLSNAKIQSLERTLSDVEFEAVKEAVSKALGLWTETGGGGKRRKSPRTGYWRTEGLCRGNERSGHRQYPWPGFVC